MEDGQAFQAGVKEGLPQCQLMGLGGFIVWDADFCLPSLNIKASLQEVQM